ncbi:MAG: hypothetical protein AAB567_00485 [Patescibacteria group bacterium]
MNYKKILFILIIIFLVLLGGVFILRRDSSLYNPSNLGFAEPVGTLRIAQNDELQANINTFMESQISEGALGKDNYHCANILYGYDDGYAYAWVYCSGFILKENGEFEQGSASSGLSRLEYGEDFQIIKLEPPYDHPPGLPLPQPLFPKKIYDMGRPSSAEFDALHQEIYNKARSASLE